MCGDGTQVIGVCRSETGAEERRERSEGVGGWCLGENKATPALFNTTGSKRYIPRIPRQF